jgi:hypothetical protein
LKFALYFCGNFQNFFIGVRGYFKKGIIFWQGSDTMAYFNYHAKAKQLIADGHLTRFEIVDKWNNISPALVLYFDNNKPMPIREYRFDEYLKILN